MRSNEPSRKTKEQKAKQQSTINFRMNVIFFCIFLIFSTLIFRLGYLQIVKGEYYVNMVESTEEVPVNTSVPRGRIFDRNGRVLVDNDPQNAITYTKMQTTKQEEMLEVAEQLAMLIEQPTKKVTLRDKQDFWILRNPDAAAEKVPAKEREKIRAQFGDAGEKEFTKAVDDLTRERITDEDLKSLEGHEMEVLAIYREMVSGYNLSPQIIKSEDVTDEEFARVSERLSELPGVNTTTDWKRVKLSPLAILGRTTTPERGIPNDQLNYFLARDYSRNDRVGDSFVEAQYEELLQGKKAVVKNVTDKSGKVVDTATVYEGEPGKDLVLTIDSELEDRLGKIVETELRKQKTRYGSHLLDRTFLVMMNPKNGELLSVIGRQIEDGEMQDISYGAYTMAYEAGSTIKGATVLGGYQEGAFQIGEGIVDQPLFIGGQKRSSLANTNGYNNRWMNDIAALESSSNVYMFYVAMRIGGIRNYYPRMNFNIADDTYQKMRNIYHQFGLGVKTGIDLPNEQVGVKGSDNLQEKGKAMDFAIGQYDTYTPMQLAQYVSVIANDGYRVKPHILKEVREPSLDGKVFGELLEERTPQVINRVNNSLAEINQVKAGFRAVYAGSHGTARSFFADAKYQAAGKTGTAETQYYGNKEQYRGSYTLNLTHVGFAPYDNPEVAYAVVMPYMTTSTYGYDQAASDIARKALDAYFEIKAKHNKAGDFTPDITKKIQPAWSEEVIREGEEK
ncbi:MAG TPA: penicillin-binding protein 2 [Metalysinibacillus jejuensis]|uniref:Penicillin-binding protein 2 n=1 Tax=Metalysinibacillus jejuensis TaxID=914327 RepID=A0A921NCD8_9BACL|nr:penicillin-binding protein 2 [Metalysinibacillus jejuensis]HJH11295.1 penicillin-binding protein 2 [Metalysinibacillus jejuensis]